MIMLMALWLIACLAFWVLLEVATIVREDTRRIADWEADAELERAATEPVERPWLQEEDLLNRTLLDEFEKLEQAVAIREDEARRKALGPAPKKTLTDWRSRPEGQRWMASLAQQNVSEQAAQQAAMQQAHRSKLPNELLGNIFKGIQ